MKRQRARTYKKGFKKTRNGKIKEQLKRASQLSIGSVCHGYQ